jgi:uncharacterized OB-fold protein
MQYLLTSNKFIAGFREGKFLGLKCNECGAYTVPPQKVCSECHSENMKILELSGNGEVQTFTVIHVPAEGFNPPYIVSLVKLEEGPWVVANIIDFAPEQANMELIGKKGKLGYKEIKPDAFSGGERIALTFRIKNME